MRLKGRLANKIVSWITTITLIIQVVLSGGLFNFGIKPAMAANTVTIITPNASSDWDIGSTQAITWTVTGDVDNFKLYYSNNNGTDWILIDDTVAYVAVPPTQTYNWQVPVVVGPGESDFRMKIESWYGGALQGTNPIPPETWVVREATANQTTPAIEGDNIVWTDARDGDFEIYRYIISTSTETNITRNVESQTDPDVDGDRIVWTDARDGNNEIYMYTISTDTTTNITNNASHQTEAAIDGDIVVWTDVRDGNSEIYMKDVSVADLPVNITNNSFSQTKPAINGDHVVWMDTRNGATDVYMYTISTAATIQITSGKTTQNNPAVYGDYVVWTDYSGTPATVSIDMYTISTGITTRISTTLNDGLTYSANNATAPAIYGNRVVWSDDREDPGGTQDIYMYNIATGTEVPICSDSTNQIYSDIYDNLVVWQDARNGTSNIDIYMYTIDMFIIDYGPIDSFSVAAPLDSCNNNYFSLTVTAKDQYGNTLTTYNDTDVRVEATAGPITPEYIGNGTYGSWSSGVASYAYYLITVNGTHTIRVYEPGAKEGTDTLVIKTCGGGPPPPPPPPGYPTSQIVGILDNSGNLVTPMPATVLTSTVSLVAEATDYDGAVNQVALYWSQVANGTYKNYGNATSISIAGKSYWKWDFVSPANGRYYFYSLARDNDYNTEELPKPFWTGIIKYDATTVISARAPSLIITNPIDQQTDVGINTTIRVVFDISMDPASVVAAFHVKKTSDGSGNFQWTAAWADSNRTVTFSPIAGQTLAYNTSYTASIDLTAKSKDGETLGEISAVPNPWSFQTALQTTTNLSTSTKVPNKNICSAGETITYTIVLRNSGTATANVTFTDSIPLNTIYNNYISNAIWDPINNRITWSGPLARNGSRTIQFRVLINQPLPNGTRITNEAQISDGVNPTVVKYGITVINSPLGDITSITPINNAPDISINTTIRFVFSLAMNKPSVEQAFKLAETISGKQVEGMTAVWSNLDRTVVFSLPAGQTLQYFIGYTITLDPSIAITAKGAPLKETTTAPLPSQFTTAKQRVPDVTTSVKIGNVDTAQPGDVITYTITLRNSGTASANISFVDPVPVDTTYYSVRNATWDSANKRIYWNGTLAVNGSRVITFRVRINTPLANGIIITNAAEIDDHFNPKIYRYATTLVQSPTAQILLTVPANSEVNVATRPSIKVTFSETMDRASTQSAFGITKMTGDPDGPLTWNAAWSISDKVATFTLATGQNLGYGAIYNVFIDPAVAKTRKGAELDTTGPVSNPWTFTTASPNMSDSSKPVDLQVAQPGQRLTYSMVLKNSGTATANITFNDQVPLNTTYYSVSGANWDSTNQKIWWKGVLAPNATRAVTFRVTIKSPLPNGTIITNSAIINDGFNPTVIKNAQTLVQSPLSQILITSPINGEMTVPIRPTIRITFSKPMDRTSTQNSFSLTKISGIPNGTPFRFAYVWTTGDTVLTMTLVAGQTLEYSSSYEAKIDTEIAKTKLGATVDPGSPAANPWTFYTALLNTPNLTNSTKAVNLQVANPGSVLLYTVVLRNSSDFAATVNVEDYIPANTAYTNYKTGVWTYDAILRKMTLKNRVMPARSTLTMTFQVKVNPVLPTGTVIHNEVSINDGVNPIFSRIAETYIQAHTDFSTSSKQAVNDNPERATGIAEPGDILTYTITVNNTGDMDAIDTYVTDLVPQNTSLVEGSISEGIIYEEATRTLRWLGTIPVQVGKILTFKAKVDEDSGLFGAPNDKVINDAVITDLTDSFTASNSTTIVIPPCVDCGGGGGNNPDNPPYLLTVEPANGTKSVKLYAPIKLTFSENVNGSSLVYLTRIGERLIDTKNWSITESDGSATLTLQPDKPLESGSTYTIQVVDVIDADGQGLDPIGPILENTFSFTTVRPRLYFVDKQMLKFKAGTISSAIEIKLGDWTNYDDENSSAPVYAPYVMEGPVGLTVRLWGTSTTGKFDISPTGTFDKSILDIILPVGTDSLTVYYTDSVVNTPLVYKMVAYPPYIYPLYLVYSDERSVQTNDGSGGTGSSQDRIEFITDNQSVPVNFFSNPFEIEIRGVDGQVITLKAGKTFLLGTTSNTGRFYNSYKLPLDEIVIVENRNYYRMALPTDNTKATFYYKDSTPGPYVITVKDEGISIAEGNGPALDGNQTINIIPIKDQDIPSDKKLLAVNDETGRKLAYITVEPTDTILMPGKKQEFVAKGFDTEGKEITSLQFGWYVITGGGTITQPITGSHTATFTAGKTAGVYYDTVMAAAMYNGDLQGGYATVRVARVLDYGLGGLPSTGPNGIQVIFIILMLLSAVALAEVEHYEKTHFPAKKPRFAK